MDAQAKMAEYFRSLHRQKDVLILPNAWDVPSARVFEDSGFSAVATSSAGLAVSLGYTDGETIPREEMVAAVGRIARKLSIPLSADIVGGFGRTTREVRETVRLILEAGAVGVNIEDFVHGEGRLIPADEQIERLRAIREEGTSMGIPVVINARTEALRLADGDEIHKIREALKRCTAYRDAGADCVYPMGLTDADAIEKFVRELNFPVNVMIRKGLPEVSALRRMGVARISFGPGASYAAMALLRRASREILERGTYHALTDDVITFDELNRLAERRHG